MEGTIARDLKRELLMNVIKREKHVNWRLPVSLLA